MTKENLKEYRCICEELRQLDERHVEWTARAERSTRPPSLAPVMGGERDHMPMIMDRLTEIQRKADRLVSRLTDAKMRIENAIEKLPSIQRQVMRARYIEGKCWEVIAEEMSYSEQRLYQLHRKALQSLNAKK